MCFVFASLANGKSGRSKCRAMSPTSPTWFVSTTTPTRAFGCTPLHSRNRRSCRRERLLDRRLSHKRMAYEPSPLAPAMNVALGNRRPVQPGNEQALGWNVYRKGADQVIFRDGSSFGYASVMAYYPKSRIGVVVLMNQVGDIGDIARHL